MRWIDGKFGTWRGMVRTALGYAELASGRLAPFRPRDPETVRRLVFVCLGNICRSAYGHHVAAAAGMNVASLGLSTSTGSASPREAVAAAARKNLDMRAHRALDWGDFEVQPGDMFLVMEVRQAHELRRRLGDRTDVQVCLLGLFSPVRMAHLHDPFSLSDAYFDTCFARIDETVQPLREMFPNARAVIGLSHAAAPERPVQGRSQ
jgi:protein-tyrosine phosphatase